VKPQVLYIGGAGRSGSTVLATMLGGFEGFVPVGEVRYLWDRGLVQNHLCGCRRPFRECPFWTDVITDAFGGMAAVDAMDMTARAAAVDRARFVPALARPGLRRQGFSRALTAYGDIVSRLYQSIVAVSGARVVVDSSKDPSYAFVLEALPSIDLSVVHLVRDSRAVAYSWTRARVRPEIHWTVEYMQRRRPFRSARRWAVNNALFDVLGRGHPRFVRLRYEDFVAGPTESLAALAALPALARGLDTGHSAAVPRVGDAFVHSVSGNPSRFDGRPVRLTIDDEWQRSLPARDRRVVTLATAPLLARYGYLRPA